MYIKYTIFTTLIYIDSDLDSNNLTGDIPSSVLNLKNLSILYELPSHCCGV